MNFDAMFLEGSMPSLKEVLKNREERVAFIKALFEKYPGQTVLSLKCNIPGPIKNNMYIGYLFNWGKNKVKKIIEAERWQSVYEQDFDFNTGPEYFAVISEKPEYVKEKMILFEEEKGGRVFDADILCMKNEEVFSLSRHTFNMPGRKCFICSNQAALCAGRRIHTVSELQQKIIAIAKEEFL